VSYVHRLPAAGETVAAGSFERRPGGKGANQAVAAARLDLETALVGAVGDDPFGTETVDALRTEKVRTEDVRVVAAPTGTAAISVDDVGENTIVISRGANAFVSIEGVDLAAPDAVLCQLEIPLGVVIDAASGAEGIFCLNASPWIRPPAQLLARCDLVVVNEHEHDEAGGALEDCRLVAVTLGPKGAVLLERGREVASCAAPSVEAVDAVGAGDAFVAAFVAAMLEGRSLQATLERACRAGALAVTRRGTQAAFPTRDELDEPRWTR